MIPGMGRVSPKALKRLQKQLESQMEELEDVEEVIIKTATKDLYFKQPSVTKMNVMGQMSYQVVGAPEIFEKAKPLVIPDEDIDLVAGQANVSREEALKALKECEGNPADAILKLIS